MADSQWQAVCDAASLGRLQRVTVMRTGGSFAMHRIQTADRSWLCKSDDANGRVREEYVSLTAIAHIGELAVPEPMHFVHVQSCDHLLMPWHDSGVANTDQWAAFGAALARHQNHGGNHRFGFDHDNHCGDTPQPNLWHDDWVAFNRNCRIGYQIQRAASAGLLSTQEHRALNALCEDLHRWLPASPEPALLHGDLWSGNAIARADGTILVIDPCCSWGDGWADIAMMELFGGFPAACLDTFESHRRTPRPSPQCMGVYRLYHVLNHVNLFGRGYVSQAMDIVRLCRT